MIGRIGAQETTLYFSPYTFKPSPFGSHQRLLSYLRRESEKSRMLRLLDVGGGEGYLAAALSALGHRVTCLAKPGSVSTGCPADVSVIEADLDLTRPDLSVPFDVVICGDVLEHLRDPLPVLRWLVTLLRDDGFLLASLPNGVHAFVRLNVMLGRFPQHERGLFDRTHLHFYPWSAWRRLFALAELEVVERSLTPVPFSVLFAAWRRLFPLALGLEAAALILARLAPGLFAYQFVVKVEKFLGKKG